MFSRSQKGISFKFIAILTCSFISALGTVPYGFRFAQPLDTYNHSLFLVVGGLFALMSLTANVALGSYSLLNTNLKQKLVNVYYLFGASIISAVPYGFIGYFGFKDYLPFFVNLPISLMVVVVNTGIAYSAIYNFLLDMFKKKTKKVPFSVQVVHQLGFIIGFLVSVTIYVATVHGMTILLESINVNSKTAFFAACLLGIPSWIPFAALYSNSTQIVSEEVYNFVTKNLSKIAKMDRMTLLFIIIAIGSGASFAQIAIDFFKPSANIPAFFKVEMMQFFIYKFVIPCAFFSAAGVNYLALQRLFEKVRNVGGAYSLDASASQKAV